MYFCCLINQLFEWLFIINNLKENYDEKNSLRDKKEWLTNLNNDQYFEYIYNFCLLIYPVYYGDLWEYIPIPDIAYEIAVFLTFVTTMLLFHKNNGKLTGDFNHCEELHISFTLVVKYI